jgi:hypothetical protein
MKNNAGLLRLAAAHQAYELEVKACFIGLCLLAGHPCSSSFLTLVLELTVKWHAEGQ